MAEGNGSDKPIQSFTSSDRIRQLNEIDKDVAKLIHSAGLAIQALTNARPSDSLSADNSLESHKARFKEATSQYFALLSSIDVRLRRQVYALEEASILGPDTTSRSGDLSGTGAAAGASNPLDVSWLNSRKDTVGKEKEAELWAAARHFVQNANQAQTGKDGRVKVEGGQESMEVD
ncbi:mediator complex protein-domain-containing protein [Aspergillus karnatakaensis]|uniref:mediator of RNA polymerase II transcription subunit 11 n=1 Tax=Aspergillus karnatakaensis TaxID=1810916 RepID=UPI003CCD899B